MSQKLISIFYRRVKDFLTRRRVSKRKLHFADAVSSAYVGTVESVAAENRENPCSARVHNVEIYVIDFL